MKLDSLKFPVLCLRKDSALAELDINALTTTTKAALSGGLYEDLRIVDSDGVEALVVSARKLHGLGVFFGYNLFFNQRIRIDIEIDFTGRVLVADDVRNLVLKDFRGWHG